MMCCECWPKIQPSWILPSLHPEPLEDSVDKNNKLFFFWVPKGLFAFLRGLSAANCVFPVNIFPPEVQTLPSKSTPHHRKLLRVKYWPAQCCKAAFKIIRRNPARGSMWGEARKIEVSLHTPQIIRNESACRYSARQHLTCYRLSTSKQTGAARAKLTTWVIKRKGCSTSAFCMFSHVFAGKRIATREL